MVILSIRQIGRDRLEMKMWLLKFLYARQAWEGDKLQHFQSDTSLDFGISYV